MKSILVFIFALIFVFLPAQAQTTFQQDIAQMHGTKNGLPDGVITQLTLVDQTLVAQVAGQSYIWNQSQWKPTKDAIQEIFLEHLKGPTDTRDGQGEGD